MNPQSDATDLKRSVISQVIKFAFGLAVLAFGVIFVASRWSRVSAALNSAKPGWIVAALAFAAIGQWTAALGFRVVLAASARDLPVIDVARVHFVSQLGKYIPGSVWPILAVTELGRRYGIARRVAAAAAMVSLLFSLVTAVVVGITFVLLGAAGSTSRLWFLLLLVPLALAAIHPRIVVSVVNLGMRLIRRSPVELNLTGPVLRRSLGWSVVSWLLLGLQCWALVAGLGGGVLSSIAPSIGGFSLAYAAGTLFVPAPAGAGVREVVLAVALVGVVKNGSPFNHDSVIVVVLLSRVLLAVLDFAQAGIVLLVARRRSSLTES